MSDKHPITSESLLESPSRADPPLGFAALAKRISGWTSRLVASGIVLVAGLSIGRQMIAWWSVDAPAPAAQEAPGPAGSEADSAGLGESGVLEFGDLAYRVQRQSLRGDKGVALAWLRKECRNALDRGGLPHRQIGPAEQELLRQIAKEKPVAEGPPGRRLHQLDGAFPMVVGTLDPGVTRSSSGEGSSAVALSGRRVIIWGMGVPMAGDVWALYTFQAESTATPFRSSLQPALPPGARRTMAVRDANGGGMAAFGGSGPPQRWIGFYDRWFRQHGWSVASAWQLSGAVWHARYEQGGSGSVDVQFAPADSNGLVGLVTITPATSGSTEGKSP
ncbi:MAG: hypothetical protein ACYC35_25105 [Pirellulales bacterium]